MRSQKCERCRRPTRAASRAVDLRCGLALRTCAVYSDRLGRGGGRWPRGTQASVPSGTTRHVPSSVPSGVLRIWQVSPSVRPSHASIASGGGPIGWAAADEALSPNAKTMVDVNLLMSCGRAATVPSRTAFAPSAAAWGTCEFCTMALRIRPMNALDRQSLCDAYAATVPAETNAAEDGVARSIDL